MTALVLENGLTAPAKETTVSRAATEARMPSLDGLRAIAILCVILGHLSGTRLFPGFLSRSTMLANFGVRIFFVLSGFLITTLLLDEIRKRGKISLKRFYFRRSLRILPAFYTYMLTVTLLSAAGLWRVGSQDLLRAATFVSDYDAYRPWQTGHAWSLAVEEQFYLLWPFLMAFLGVSAAVRAALAAVLLAPALRIGIWCFAPEWRPLIDSGFFTAGDALATGCLLACYRPRLDFPAYNRWIRSRWFLAVPAIAFVANLVQHHTRSLPLSYALGQTVMHVCIALCLDRAVRIPDDFCGRILNTPLLARVGVMSYSIYLWQQLFLNRTSDLWICAFPINTVLAIAAGCGSYYLVEKTFLRWRAAMERRRFA